MLKVVSDGILSPGCGFVMIAVIMFSLAGIFPIGIGLQEPVMTCLPFVIVSPEQKLMKFAGSLHESAPVQRLSLT